MTIHKDNVIAFPGTHRESPPQSLEELFAKVETTRREHINYIMDDMIPNMLSYLYLEGFDLNRDDCEKTTAFFVEAFEAALLKSVRLEHPLHDVAEDFWTDVEEDTEKK